MTKFVFQSPGRYVQGAGMISELGKETAKIGNSALLIADKVVWDITSKSVEESFQGVDIKYNHLQFSGEASGNEIGRLADEGKKFESNVVIGLGGGKTLDTAKDVADGLRADVVIVPKKASTDAPTGASSVNYEDDSDKEGSDMYDI